MVENVSRVALSMRNIFTASLLCLIYQTSVQKIKTHQARRALNTVGYYGNCQFSTEYSRLRLQKPIASQILLSPKPRTLASMSKT